MINNIIPMGVITHQLNVVNLADLQIKLPLLFHKIARMQEEENREQRINRLVFAEVHRLNDLPARAYKEDYLTKIIEGQRFGFLRNADQEWEFLGYALDEVVVTAKRTQNVRGFVRAEKGIRLREGDENYIGDKRDFIHEPATEVLVLQVGKEKKQGWLRVKIANCDEVGWVERSYIEIIHIYESIEKYTKEFYYVKSGDTLEGVIKNVYGSAQERRRLTQAFVMLNHSSGHNHGIRFVEGETTLYEDVVDGLKDVHDPWMSKAREMYRQVQLSKNHIIRIPTLSYVDYLESIGSIATRPEIVEFLKEVGELIIDIAAGTAGLVVGIIEGFFTALWDALVGLVELVEQIYKVFKSLIDGSFLEDLKKMYDALMGLSIKELKELALGILGPLGEAITQALEDWNNLSVFEKSRLVGKIIGAIVFEIVLAVFTGGTVNAAKWTAKLGKLGKGLGKIAKFGDKVKDKVKQGIPKKYRKYLREDGRSDYDTDPDGKNFQRQMLLNLGRAMAIAEDKSGSMVTELITHLYAESKLLFPKLNVKWTKERERDGVYDVYFKASPRKKVIDNFTDGHKDKELTQEERTSKINNSGSSEKAKKGLQKLNKKNTPEGNTAIDSYLDNTNIRGRVIKNADALENALNKDVVAKYLKKYKGKNLIDGNGNPVDLDKLTEGDLKKLFAAGKGELRMIAKNGEKINITFEAHHIIPKDLLLDDRMESLRKFLHRNKDKFDFNGPDNGVPVHKFNKQLETAGGHGNHPDYSKMIRDKILKAQKEAESLEGLDDEIYDIIKNARNTIKEKVVSTGETAAKINDLTF